MMMISDGSCLGVSSVPVSVSSVRERSTSLCLFSLDFAIRKTGESRRFFVMYEIRRGRKKELEI